VACLICPKDWLYDEFACRIPPPHNLRSQLSFHALDSACFSRNGLRWQGVSPLAVLLLSCRYDPSILFFARYFRFSSEQYRCRPELLRFLSPTGLRSLSISGTNLLFCRWPLGSPSALQSAEKLARPRSACCSPAQIIRPLQGSRDSGSVKLYCACSVGGPPPGPSLVPACFPCSFFSACWASRIRAIRVSRRCNSSGSSFSPRDPPVTAILFCCPPPRLASTTAGNFLSQSLLGFSFIRP